MYESPIKVLRQQIETEIEAEAMKAVLRLGVVVDKEELLKALEYDRGQYQKGYQDAVRHGRWITKYDILGNELDVCSECGEEAVGYDTYMGDYRTVATDYCPHCGAKMDQEDMNNEND